MRRQYMNIYDTVYAFIKVCLPSGVEIDNCPAIVDGDGNLTVDDGYYGLSAHCADLEKARLIGSADVMYMWASDAIYVATKKSFSMTGKPVPVCDDDGVLLFIVSCVIV